MGGINGAMSKVYAISVGAQKGMPKSSVERVCLREDHGLEGDCHAGPGARQVSLLAWEDALSLRQKGIAAKPGDFAENIATEGIDLSKVPVGAKLRVGGAVLEIAEIGKSDWKKGDYSFKEIALVARCGLFARVIRGGWVSAGDSIMMEQ